MRERINYMLLGTAMLGTFFSGTASRIFNISMPSMAGSLGTDLLGISWALLAYQLSNIGLSMIFGRVADLWSREKLFALGFTAFSLGSLLCGLSQTVLQLIVFRFVQGIGGAMLQSSSRALAAEAVPEEYGGRAQGYMTTAHHTGFLLGPALGGLVIDYLSWRWTFFFLVPIGLVGASLALANPRTRSVAARGRSVDYLGATLVFATTTALVLFLDRRTLDLLGAQTKGALAIAFLGSLSALVMHESRAPNPFFNFALFKIRLFSLSALSLLIVAIGYTLPAFVLPFYLQDILHLSPSFIGILFMAPAIVTIMLAPLSGWMTDRLGPRLPASLGVIFLIVSLLLGMFFKTDSHWLLPGSMIALGAITNGIFNPANSAAMITLMPRGERGFASAVNHVTFGLGNVLGVALGGLFMTAAFEYHTGLSGVSPTTSNAPGFVEALNTTLMLTAGIVFIGLVTSAIRGGRAAPAASL